MDPDITQKVQAAIKAGAPPQEAMARGQALQAQRTPKSISIATPPITNTPVSTSETQIPTSQPEQQGRGSLIGSLAKAIFDPLLTAGKTLGSAAIDIPTALGGGNPTKGNMFLSEEEKRKLVGVDKNGKVVDDMAPLKNAVKQTAGVASFILPVGRGIKAAASLGAASGALRGVSEGEDISAGNIASGAAGGAIGGAVLPAIGKGVGAVTKKVPERLMNSVFKESLKDTRAGIRGGSTLGKKALDKGIKGISDENIYTNAVSKIDTLENQLQTDLTASTRIIPIADIKQGVAPLIKRYAAAGNTNAVSNITNRIDALEAHHGKSIPVAVANEVKRTLYDEARNGYGQLASENIEGVKTIARALKEGIASKVKGVDEINKELSFNGKIADSLLDKMARGGRNNLIGLTQGAITAGGLAGAVPSGGLSLLPAIAMGALGTVAGKTGIAQGLNQVGKGLNQVGSIPGLLPGITKAGQVAGSMGGIGTKNTLLPVMDNNQNSTEPQNGNQPFHTPSVVPQPGENVNTTGQLPPITGYTTEQLGTALAKATMAGDTKAATAIKNLYDVETNYQKQTGKNKPLPVSAQNMKNLATSGLKGLKDAQVMFEEDPNIVVKGVVTGGLANRKFEAALNRAIEGVLRARSGAAVPETEVKKYRQMYGPRLGDSKDDALYKLSALQQDLQGILDGSNNISPDVLLPAIQ